MKKTSPNLNFDRSWFYVSAVGLLSFLTVPVSASVQPQQSYFSGQRISLDASQPSESTADQPDQPTSDSSEASDQESEKPSSNADQSLPAGTSQPDPAVNPSSLPTQETPTQTTEAEETPAQTTEGESAPQSTQAQMWEDEKLIAPENDPLIGTWVAHDRENSGLIKLIFQAEGRLEMVQRVSSGTLRSGGTYKVSQTSDAQDATSVSSIRAINLEIDGEIWRTCFQISPNETNSQSLKIQIVDLFPGEPRACTSESINSETVRQFNFQSQ
jgi:hypothetical protein